MPASPSSSPRLWTLLFGLVVFSAGSGCRDVATPPDSEVDRETFIATYVDLRLAALGHASGEITDEDRARVLAENDVTEDDLLAFADAWGGDPATMKGIWEEVEQRLRTFAGEDTIEPGGVAR